MTGFTEYVERLKNTPSAYGPRTGWSFFYTSPLFYRPILSLSGAVARIDINTEELTGISAVVREPFKLSGVCRHLIGGPDYDFQFFCTTEGHLFAGGIRNRNYSGLLGGNALGFGPDFPQTNYLSPVEQQQRIFTKSGASLAVGTKVTRVLGENGELSSVKFVEVWVVSYGQPIAVLALDSNGDIWYSGQPYKVKLEPANSFAQGDDLFYFEKKECNSYISPAGSVEGPVKFRSLFTVAQTLFATTTTGKLLLKGDVTHIGISPDAQTGRASRTNFYECSGFVDSVTIVNRGQGYSGGFGKVEFSLPQHPEGTRASGYVVTDNNGGIERIDILDPGWGYTSPPSITFLLSPNDTADGASATCEIFSGTWQKIKGTIDSNGRYTLIAISSQGIAYLFGYNVLTNRLSTNRTYNSPIRIPGQSSAGYIDCALIAGENVNAVSDCVFLRSDGVLEYIGQNPLGQPLPRDDRSATIRVLNVSDRFTSVAANNFALFCFTQAGSVFAYNYRFRFLNIGGNSVFSSMVQGNSIVAFNRVETFDDYGNRINPLPNIRRDGTAIG
jgi:hypothetical protein